MRFMTFIVVGVFSLSGGSACRLSPIPERIETYHASTQEAYPTLNDILQEGDLIFRKGHARILNDLIDFSNLTSKWCDSPFSHVGLVFERHGDTFIIVDCGPYGIERRFLVDWLIEGPENVVVKRLHSDYRHKIPDVLAVARRLVEQDVLYDPKYKADDGRFYCTELADYCFREAGLPLADKVRIRELPRLRPWYAAGMVWTLSHMTHIGSDQPVVVAGNKDYGLFSSEFLTEVTRVAPGPQKSAEIGEHARAGLSIGLDSDLQ